MKADPVLVSSPSPSRGCWPGSLCWSTWRFSWKWAPVSCGVKSAAGWWSRSFRFSSMRTFISCLVFRFQEETIMKFEFKVWISGLEVGKIIIFFSPYLCFQGSFPFDSSSVVQIWHPDLTSHNPPGQKRRTHPRSLLPTFRSWNQSKRSSFPAIPHYKRASLGLFHIFKSYLKIVLISSDGGHGEQEDGACFVGQRSGRVIRPLNRCEQTQICCPLLCLLVLS